MNLRVVFRKAALNDLGSTIEWYELQRLGLGERFFQAVEQAIDSISIAPSRPAPLLPGIRRIRVRMFPHFVYYTFDESQCVVLAILHFRRNPSSWKGIKT